MGMEELKTGRYRDLNNPSGIISLLSRALQDSDIDKYKLLVNDFQEYLKYAKNIKLSTNYNINQKFKDNTINNLAKAIEKICEYNNNELLIEKKDYVKFLLLNFCELIIQITRVYENRFP